MVDVGIHAEKSLKDDLNYCHEVFGERNSKLTRKYLLIIQLVFHPCHQKVDIFTCTHLERRLHVMSVSPEIFILGSGGHGRARLSCAKFCQNSVEHVDFVIKLNCVHGKPFV